MTNRKIPYLTVALVIINAVVFFIMNFTVGTETDMLYKYGAVYYDDVVNGGQWWRLIASCFLHFDITHLAFNMFSLYAVGSSLESEYGKTAFSVSYAFSGIAGGAAAMFLYHYQGTDFVAAGASGAICGLVGFWVVRMILDSERRSWLEFIRPVIAAALIIYSGAENPEVDQYAHVFGLIGGALVSLFYRRKR